MDCDTACRPQCRLLAEAENPDTEVTRLEEMALTSNDVCFYWGDLDTAIAQNPSTGAETLLFIAGASMDVAREAVAEHPNAPVEALKILATDEHPYVRISVFNNPNTPPEVAVAIDQSDWEHDDE